VRGKAWADLIGNGLQITPDLYDILKSRNPPATKKDSGVSYPLSAMYIFRHASLLDDSAGKENSISIIKYDIPRTFTEDHRFQNTPAMTAALHHLLHVYARYRPDVGYVQGMSYVAAMCVYYMDEYTAFQTFSNILGRRMSFDFYRLRPEIVSVYTKTFDHFFKQYLPALFEHLQAEGVSSDMFLMDWTLTLFAKALPISVAARLWDVYVLDGDVFIIRASLGEQLSALCLLSSALPCAPSYIISYAYRWFVLWFLQAYCSCWSIDWKRVAQRVFCAYSTAYPCSSPPPTPTARAAGHWRGRHW
jgi:TBC1 domain family member 14